MSMPRDEAIRKIETLFPADSPHHSVRLVGHELLDRARREATDWREEPTAVLQRYAELCEEQELALARRAIRNAENGI